MINKKLKTVLSILLIFTLIFSLPIMHNNRINAASKKVKVKYVANKGTFKSNLFADKKSVSAKISKGQKRGMAPKVKKSNSIFLGWYTKKKGGKKYTSKTKITKKTTLYAHWLKKYKINNKYSQILSVTSYPTLKDVEIDTGLLQFIKKEKKYYPFIETYKTKNGDIYKLCPPSEIEATSYYVVEYITLKAKNILNIKKPTSYKSFFKKLGVKDYSKIRKKGKLDFEFVLGTVDLIYEDDIEQVYVMWQLTGNKKDKITPDTKILLSLTEEWTY